MSRKFLTRVETTYLLGLMDSQQLVRGAIKFPDEAQIKVACLSDHKIFEAKAGQILHAQITLNNHLVDVVDGFSVDDAWYESLRGMSVESEE